MKIFTRLFKNLKKNPIFIFLFFYTIFLIVLSFFRNASADEAYYLKETALMAELIRNGEWFGNYGVGLHGFLFKIPVALLFILLGESSVFISTIFTIIFSISSIFIFYKILSEYFFKKEFAIWGTLLFSVVFHLIETSISFNRDIPVLFTVLLFVLLFLKKARVELIGLTFLLMLDAKEHVFLTVAPLYAIYLLIEFLKNIKKEKIFVEIINLFKKLFIVYILPLTWVVMMFTTSLIPVNMFVSSIFGFTEVGQDWNRGNFSTEVASKNLMTGAEKSVPRISDLTEESVDCKMEDNKGDFVCIVIGIFDTIILYIGKILYPRTFSFISIPKIIVLPAIIYAFSAFLSWWKNRDLKYFLPMILFFNTIIIILRTSHGRYLLGVSFLFILFFLLFIKEGFKRATYSRNILIATTAFVILGLFFETTFLYQKIVLEISLLILLWVIWLLRKKGKVLFSFSKKIFLLALISGMFLTSVAFSSEIGQISSFTKYGYNREARELLKPFNQNEKIWINDFGSGELINVYRKNFYNEAEWNWRLADWVPKKYLLKIYSSNNTYSFGLNNIEDFHSEIRANELEKVALVVSLLEEEFPFQGKLKELKNQDWLKLLDVVELQNKKLYIFEVEKE